MSTTLETGYGGRRSSTLRTPSRTPSKSMTVTHESTLATSFTVEPVDPNCFVALIEGRGSAAGEVGLACIRLDDPTLILCQVTDSRTYARTLAKIALFNPVEILIPQVGRLYLKEQSVYSTFCRVMGVFIVALKTTVL